MNISKMSQEQLIGLANELGAYNNETFEESAKRFRDLGDNETASKFDLMSDRWFKLEN